MQPYWPSDSPVASGSRHPRMGSTEPQGQLGLPPVLQGKRGEAEGCGGPDPAGRIHDVALRVDRCQLRGLGCCHLDPFLGGTVPEWILISSPILFSTSFASAILVTCVITFQIVPDNLAKGLPVSRLFTWYEIVMHNGTSL